MKIKASISIEEETIKQVEERMSEGIFRNKSHFIELAVEKLLQEVRK